MTSAPGGPDRASGSIHVPVLVREVIQYLDLRPGLTCVDATVGGGGHSKRILESIGAEGTLIGVDRDPSMLKRASTALDAPNCHLHQGSYVELPRILTELNIDAVDRILLDLGYSSDQLADQERGFSFESEGPLDMRFDQQHGEPAWELLERLSEQEISRILLDYGEERFHRTIAREIADSRRRSPIRTARDLSDAVNRALPRTIVRTARKDPATRVFQALRIAVNDELEHFERALHDVFYDVLHPGGKLVVITFHSLEDRLVKQRFRHDRRWHIITPKPVAPSRNEQNINPRSRSAKLRAAMRP